MSPSKSPDRAPRTRVTTIPDLKALHHVDKLIELVSLGMPTSHYAYDRELHALYKVLEHEVELNIMKFDDILEIQKFYVAFVKEKNANNLNGMKFYLGKILFVLEKEPDLEKEEPFGISEEREIQREVRGKLGSRLDEMF